MTLRDYQTTAIERIRNAYRDGFKAPLLVLPTGGGKTIVFNYIAQQTSARNKRVLILVHRVELLRQTIDKLPVSCGIISPEFTPDYTQAIQVASVQTLARRLDKPMHAPDLIIIDEAHHTAAGTWKKVLLAFPDARLLGVTATPCRSDGDGLNDFFDTLVEGSSTAELIDAGYLAKPRIFMGKKHIDMSKIATKGGDYDPAQAAEMLDNNVIIGDMVSHYAQHCPKQPAVVFAVNLKHAEHIAAEFRAQGYAFHVISGKTDKLKRADLISGLGTKYHGLVSVDLIGEGLDIPAIKAVFLCRPTISEALHLQQVGRALRVTETKKDALIFDHVGNCIRHGMPDDYRQWTLEGRKRNRRDVEATIRTLSCPMCYQVFRPAPACPSCGTPVQMPEVKEKKVLTEEELMEIEHERKQIRREVGKARTYEALLAIEKERGYKKGWAKIIQKVRYKK
jgi:superfamily II DNA or RNA helicase